MDDLISRQAAIDALCHVDEYNVRSIGAIRNLPSAQPQQKTGKWVRNFDGNEWYWFCSNCKEEWYEEDLWMGGNDFPNFCPNCGAYMGGEQDAAD